MKALILCSGAGERLWPITKNKPKPLIKIGDSTILDNLLRSFILCGIKDITITTGPFENMLKNHVARKYPALNVSYVKNQRYRNTNYIYSMWLAGETIDDDLVLVHGDLFFEKKLLERLLAERHPNCVPVNKSIRAPKKDFKAVIEGKRVLKIGVDFAGKNAFFSAPLYKFSRRDFKLWLKEIDRYVKKGELNIYAESVLNNILCKIFLKPLFFTKELCMEIDTIQDLRLAEKMIAKRKLAIN